MATNFLQWNPDVNNQETDGQYLIDSQRVNGATEGVFPSTTANKLFYQASAMVAALAEMMDGKGYTINDGSADTPGNDFAALVAVLGYLSTAIDIQNCSFVYAADTGIADAYAVAPTPAVTALVDGLCVVAKIAHTNTGVSTLAVSGLPAATIYRSPNIPLVAGDLTADGIAVFRYDGVNFQLVSAPHRRAASTGYEMFDVIGTDTFTVPVGVYRIIVECWGGGGGGSHGSAVGPQGGTGGAGGGYGIGEFEVIPGATYTVTVGAGGVAGPNGTAGSTSSFGALLSSTGGGGGQFGVNNGSPGSSTGGYLSLYGGNANYGNAYYASYGGHSGRGGPPSMTTGIGPGGGGAGGAAGANVGGNGAKGAVLVRW